MNFWKNVDYVREYRNMTRKELAYKADFSLTSLSTGIARNSIPSADVAYRIAKTLNVSIEYLLTGKEQSQENETSEITSLLQTKMLKYKPILEKLDSLPLDIQNNISVLINDFHQLIQE